MRRGGTTAPALKLNSFVQYCDHLNQTFISFRDSSLEERGYPCDFAVLLYYRSSSTIPPGALEATLAGEIEEGDTGAIVI